MKHYRILSSDNEDKLASDVEVALNDGWEIGGNFQTVRVVDRITFYQPIIKTRAMRKGV